MNVIQAMGLIPRQASTSDANVPETPSTASSINYIERALPAKVTQKAANMNIAPSEIQRWIYDDTQCPQGTVEYNPNSIPNRFYGTYCKHGYFMWACLAVIIFVVIYATTVNVRYQRWKWMNDPLGAFVIDRINNHQHIPDLGEL
jgi:hypothetical protein